jgi:RNA polymerase sigma-70 factor (ECF subfamily)
MTDREFERLVRRHGDALYAFVLYRAGDPHVAEDVVADTFERAFRARARFDRRRASELTWLISIALNRSRDLQRRRAAEAAALGRVAGDWSEPSAPDLGSVAMRASVVEAVQSLPAEERDVIALVYGADLTAKQAASVLELPVTTVQGRVYRALRRLRDALGDE